MLARVTTGAWVIAALLVSARATAAETMVDLSGTVPSDQYRHFFLEFDVPAGTKEIQVHHDDLSDTNILDWGLVDQNGFRGWGGGNTEDAVVGEQAASRSYVPGPITPGKWKVVVGKAKLIDLPGQFSVQVTFRDTPTLPAQTERNPYAPVAALKTEARWYAGDFHVHSRESGDAKPTLEEIVVYAKSRGLDFVEFSDHNTNTQLDFFASVQQNHPDFLLIPGVEFTTYWGHANGIGATDYVDDKTELPGNSIVQAVQKFHAQGALFSINHPTLDVGDACIGCGWKQDLPVEDMDGVEIGTGKFGVLTDSAVTLWDQLSAQGHHLVAMGGSDDHTAGVEKTPLDSPIGNPTTMVFAQELSVKGIMDGIRAGRTVVKLEAPTNPMIDLESDVARNGDTIHAKKAHLSATITGGVGYTARWVENGEPEPDVDIDKDPFVLETDVVAPASGEDRWRVEALSAGKRRSVTSHLYITASVDDAGVGGSGAGGSAAGGNNASGDASGGGCGCGVAPRSGFGALGLGLLFALGWARRRRRSTT